LRVSQKLLGDFFSPSPSFLGKLRIVSLVFDVALRGKQRRALTLMVVPLSSSAMMSVSVKVLRRVSVSSSSAEPERRCHRASERALLSFIHDAPLLRFLTSLLCIIIALL
jgi:hypothetical protein